MFWRIWVGLSLICLFTLSWPRVDLMLFGCSIIWVAPLRGFGSGGRVSLHGFSEWVQVGFQMSCRKPPVLRGHVSAVDLSLHDHFVMAQAQSRLDWLGFLPAQELKIGIFWFLFELSFVILSLLCVEFCDWTFDSGWARRNPQIRKDDEEQDSCASSRMLSGFSNSKQKQELAEGNSE